MVTQFHNIGLDLGIYAGYRCEFINNEAWANMLMVFLVCNLVQLYLCSGDVRLEFSKIKTLPMFVGA